MAGGVQIGVRTSMDFYQFGINYIDAATQISSYAILKVEEIEHRTFKSYF